MTKHLYSSVVSQIWLNYYNQTLYRRGVITEAAYRQMLLALSRKNPFGCNTNRQFELR